MQSGEFKFCLAGGKRNHRRVDGLWGQCGSLNQDYYQAWRKHFRRNRGKRVVTGRNENPAKVIKHQA
jgi:hypothetical protein